jgi:hypothetical protein
MPNKTLLAAAMAAALGISGVATTGIAHADGILSFMNPFEWFDDDGNWDDRYYRHGPYGWGGPYSWRRPYGYGYPGHEANRTIIVLPPESDNRTAAVYPE